MVQKQHSLIQKHNDQNIQRHHQNIKMITHNLTLKGMIASMGVSVPLCITEVPAIKVPDIPPVTNFSKMLVYKDSDPPTYQHLHHISIILN